MASVRGDQSRPGPAPHGRVTGASGPGAGRAGPRAPPKWRRRSTPTSWGHPPRHLRSTGPPGPGAACRGTRLEEASVVCGCAALQSRWPVDPAHAPLMGMPVAPSARVVALRHFQDASPPSALNRLSTPCHGALASSSAAALVGGVGDHYLAVLVLRALAAAGGGGSSPARPSVAPTAPCTAAPRTPTLCTATPSPMDPMVPQPLRPCTTTLCDVGAARHPGYLAVATHFGRETPRPRTSRLLSVALNECVLSPTAARERRTPT